MEDLGHVKHLYAKYIDNCINKAERAELYRFFRDADDHAIGTVVDSYLHETHASPDLSHLGTVTGRVFQRVAAITNPPGITQQPSPSRRPWRPLVAAATVLALLSAGLWLYLSNGGADMGTEAATILAGANRATLTLSDGRLVDLSADQSGIVIGDGITYLDGSAVLGEPTGTQTQELTLTTPKGGTYQVILPDGSKAWLNANSTLRYPSRFTGEAREVILEGEAFFEIKELQGTDHARVPFNVLSAGQAIQVLGTKFNVNAYPDEPAITTSLLEGKVRVVPENQEEPVELLPGQQAKLADGRLDVGSVDVSAIASWTKDVFVFQNTDLANIMRQLERWYDVRYEGNPMPEIRYYAVISRKANLQEVLALLEETGDVRFLVKERRVMLQK